MNWELRAGCKVNLYLEIIGIRGDGYHEIESLFIPLPEPCDVLRIEERAESGISLGCSEPSLASKDNILVKAYERFARATGFSSGVFVYLEKNIPTGAGLGGGSSDAAAFLRWLNSRAGDLSLDKDGLCQLAASLGADVPFFLFGRPAWATGIGEQLRDVDIDLAGLTMVLVCPKVRVNTRWAYARWDAVHGQQIFSGRKSLTLAEHANKNLCFTNLADLWNTFESVVFTEFPELYEIKMHLLRSNADACVMSGSGSSIVALFFSESQAARAADAMRERGASCYVLSSEKLAWAESDNFVR